MPASGDQHQSWTNPFEEQKTRVAIWSAKEIATIAARLDRQLGPEYISTRAGPGGQRVHYLSAEKCIALANEVFGFNGWSSSIQNIQVDFADENPHTQRVSIGLSVIVRITLRDGTYHEDIGYGSIENAKGKAMAFEKAKKEGTTDGMKRALRNFGNVLGNCVYDKDYVNQVVKIKAQPTRKFDQNNLHRHPDFKKEEKAPQAAPAPAPAPVPAPAPPAAAVTAPKLEWSESFDDLIGELDEVDFCVPEDGHPDEVVLADQAAGQDAQVKPPTNQPPSRSASTGPNGRPPQTPNQNLGQNRPGPAHGGNGGPAQQQNRPQPPQNRPPLNQTTSGPPAQAPETVGFFSAKAVNMLPESSFQADSNHNPLGAPRAQQMFNPKAESPSIRKTPGIDHSSSRPVAKNGQHVAPGSSQANQSDSNGFTPVRPSVGGSVGARGNMTNPNMGQTRRIGAPGASASPLSNRNSFRQPTMKRPPPQDGNGGNGANRPALADIPTNPTTKVEPGADGLEAKRPRLS